MVHIQDEYSAQVKAYSKQEQLLQLVVDVHQQHPWHKVHRALKKYRVYVALQCPEHWFGQELLTPPLTLHKASPLQQDDWVQQQLIMLQGIEQAPFYWDYSVQQPSSQWQIHYLSQSCMIPWLSCCQHRYFNLAAITSTLAIQPTGWLYHWPDEEVLFDTI